MENKLVDFITNERREAANFLFFSIFHILDEVDVCDQALLLLDEMARAAIFGGASLDKVLAVYEYCHGHIHAQPGNCSKEQIIQCLERTLKDFLKILNQDSAVKQHSLVVEKVILYLRAHLARDFKLDEIAQSVNFSTYRLCHIFKQETGMSIGQFHTNLRMLEAKHLLTNTNQTIKSISIQLGYKDPSYFSRTFKKNTGIMPTEYRQLSRNNNTHVQAGEETPNKRSFIQKLIRINLPPPVYRFLFNH